MFVALLVIRSLLQVEPTQLLLLFSGCDQASFGGQKNPKQKAN
jgi:hypothetical protein